MAQGKFVQIILKSGTGRIKFRKPPPKERLQRRWGLGNEGSRKSHQRRGPGTLHGLCSGSNGSQHLSGVLHVHGQGHRNKRDLIAQVLHLPGFRKFTGQMMRTNRFIMLCPCNIA